MKNKIKIKSIKLKNLMPLLPTDTIYVANESYHIIKYPTVFGDEIVKRIIQGRQHIVVTIDVTTEQVITVNRLNDIVYRRVET